MKVRKDVGSGGSEQDGWAQTEFSTDVSDPNLEVKNLQVVRS